jgi:hypothetical protein
MRTYFENEDELKSVLINWLEDKDFKTHKGVKIGNMEIDIVALAELIIEDSGEFKRTNDTMIYVFESKIATSYELMRDVIEQAVTRLLLADYVIIAVPSRAGVWISNHEKEEKFLPQEICKKANGVYSRKIGVVSVDPLKRDVIFVRVPKKSGLITRCLKDELLKRIEKPSQNVLQDLIK